MAGADLGSKSIAFSRLPGGEIDWIWGRFLGLSRVWNPGVTGGVGRGIDPWVITALTAAAVLLIAGYLLFARSPGRAGLFALALILGGAAGNLYDRILYGEVRDFIDVWPRLPWPSWLFHWPTFNVADTAIVMGVLILLFRSFFTRSGRRARAPAEG